MQMICKKRLNFIIPYFCPSKVTEVTPFVIGLTFAAINVNSSAAHFLWLPMSSSQASADTKSAHVQRHFGDYMCMQWFIYSPHKGGGNPPEKFYSP